VAAVAQPGRLPRPPALRCAVPHPAAAPASPLGAVAAAAESRMVRASPPAPPTAAAPRPAGASVREGPTPGPPPRAHARHRAPPPRARARGAGIPWGAGGPPAALGPVSRGTQPPPPEGDLRFPPPAELFCGALPSPVPQRALRPPVAHANLFEPSRELL